MPKPLLRSVHSRFPSSPTCDAFPPLYEPLFAGTSTDDEKKSQLTRRVPLYSSSWSPLRLRGQVRVTWDFRLGTGLFLLRALTFDRLFNGREGPGFFRASRFWNKERRFFIGIGEFRTLSALLVLGGIVGFRQGWQGLWDGSSPTEYVASYNSLPS